MGSPLPLRCVIVDDNATFIDSASKLLSRDGFMIVGVASNIAEAIKVVASVSPDVTIVDVYLGRESGFALAELLGGSDASPVILTSTHSEQEFADMITESAALGFVPKAELSSEAIRRLLTDSAAQPE